MVVTFTDDVDADDKKRVHSINLVAAAGAATVNIRRGALAGAIVQSIPLAANEKFLFAWPSPLYVVEGVFVECTAAIAFGAIDLY